MEYMIEMRDSDKIIRDFPEKYQLSCPEVLWGCR